MKTIKSLMLEDSEQTQMTGKADCQVPVTKDQNIPCSYIWLLGVEVFLLYKSLVLGFRYVDISQIDSSILSWMILLRLLEIIPPLMPSDSYTSLGNLTTSHTSEEQRQSLRACIWGLDKVWTRPRMRAMDLLQQ